MSSDIEKLHYFLVPRSEKYTVGLVVENWGFFSIKRLKWKPLGWIILALMSSIFRSDEIADGKGCFGR